MKNTLGSLSRKLKSRKSHDNGYSTVSVDSRLSGVSSQAIITENHYSLGDPTKTANGMVVNESLLRSRTDHKGTVLQFLDERPASYLTGTPRTWTPPSHFVQLKATAADGFGPWHVDGTSTVCEQNHDVCFFGPDDQVVKHVQYIRSLIRTRS
jgi:hypothetical protein